MLCDGSYKPAELVRNEYTGRPINYACPHCGKRYVRSKLAGYDRDTDWLASGRALNVPGHSPEYPLKKPGAERFNFVELKDGTTACIADLKAGAIAAGFGPVVRQPGD